MAVAEVPAAASAALGRVRSRLYAWRWLLLFMPLALALNALISEQLPLGRVYELLAPEASWAKSLGTRFESSDGALLVYPGDAMPALASRLLAPSSTADFLALRACLADDVPADALALMLASVADAGLDFNRHNRLYALSAAQAGDCVEERMPRMADDGPAVLQLQFLQPVASVGLTALSVSELRENPVWRWIRRIMLGLGLCLVAVLFAPYVKRDHSALRWLLSVAGLGTVAGILFGCCVSVALKADIFALFTGGRSIPVGVDLAQLLLTPFPMDDFYVFTYMHAILFAVATLLLGLLARRAWADLALLAFVTETLQIFVPGRGPGLSDALVDLSGVALASGLLLLLWRSERVRLLLQ